MFEIAGRERRDETAERDQAWQITVTAPRVAQYEQKTDRELLVIRLVPGPGVQAPPE